MAFHFGERVAVVTGAGSGIGRALAVALAQKGCALALADVDEAGLAQTAALAGSGQSNRVRTDCLDVTDRAAVAAYADAVRAALGPAGLVFNNAGISRLGGFTDTAPDAFDRVMDVNFNAVVRMTRAFLPHLLETKGALVNVSSLFGLVGFLGQTHYCASKFAVRGFTESLAMELAQAGVQVSSVHPGGVKTNIVRNAAIDGETAAGADPVVSFDAVARTSPEHAAEVILRGVAHGRRRIVVGRDAALLSFFQRLFPQGYPRFLPSIFGGGPSTFSGGKVRERSGGAKRN